MTQKGKSVYGIKGYAQKAGIPLVYKVSDVDIKEETSSGKKVVVDHTKLYTLGVDAGKEDIQNRLVISEPGEGYCHFPSNGGRRGCRMWRMVCHLLCIFVGHGRPDS